MSDVLKVGENLQTGQSLASPNQNYLLLLQDDGNLVLYQIAADGTRAPYWATNTEWLPASERPMLLSMQSDAHLVLYDAANLPRWSSGTWGDGFVDPYLVLQDDSNLVIYHNGSTPIWASGQVNGAGRMDGVGLVTAPHDLESLVDSCGRVAPFIAGSTNLGDPTQKVVDVNGATYQIVEQRRRLVEDVTEHAFLSDIAQMGVWPGQVVQGGHLANGDIAPIGPLARKGGVISIPTELISASPHPQTGRVDSVNESDVNALRRSILQAVNPTDSAGILKTGFDRATTYREVAVKAGVSVKGPAFGVDANVTLNEDHRQSTVVAVIRQEFYTVTFTPDTARAAGVWQGADDAHPVDVPQLSPFVGPGNPPLYVDSVQYGRFICVTAQGSHDSTSISAALKAHWTAAYSGNVDIDTTTKQVLDSCSVKVYTVGVPGHSEFQDMTDPVNDLRIVYTSGLKLSLDNPGAPISFTCRHVTDNTLAHIGLAAEYSEPVSASGVDITDRQFQFWDGSGGGPVNTQINVNPGDTVTLHAEGRIWPGLIFFGDATPDGWIGRSAPDHALVQAGPAYCLVARFGTGRWFAAGSTWQGGVPGAETGGVLQLASNDNNWDNGDSHKHWTIHVNVVRQPASGVGIYV